MIISRTPFRISFFGGGTDYPVWYEENKGAVLATTINKHCYITCRYLPPFFEHKHRIIYSKMEHVKTLDEIQHIAVREVLKFLEVTRGLEIHYDGDLPARTGLGSSSSFTVGLLHAIYALRGKMPTKMQLAQEAIHIEQNRNKENVGSQDQTLAAMGGFNLVEFGGKNHLHVRKMTISEEKIKYFQEHLMFFFTGLSRTASEIAAEQIKNTKNKTKELTTMYNMVQEAVQILNSDTDLAEFGKLLHESWQIKRTLSDKISNKEIDDIYDSARDAGAIGGKLCGAGGGGFLLLFVRPYDRSKVKEKLKNLLHVPFKFEDLGSQIIFYKPNGYYENGKEDFVYADKY